MCYVIFYRLSQLFMGAIPAVLGFMALINNLSGFQGTVKYVIKPLITMQGTYGDSAQIWRALPAELANGVFLLMTVAETWVGVLALIGICSMLRHWRSSENFERSKSWIFMACSLGVIIWGLGFFTIGGEWFLAWQNKDLITLQPGALMYVTMMLIVFLFLRFCPKNFAPQE